MKRSSENNLIKPEAQRVRIAPERVLTLLDPDYFLLDSRMLVNPRNVWRYARVMFYFLRMVYSVGRVAFVSNLRKVVVMEQCKEFLPQRPMTKEQSDQFQEYLNLMRYTEMFPVLTCESDAAVPNRIDHRQKWRRLFHATLLSTRPQKVVLVSSSPDICRTFKESMSQFQGVSGVGFCTQFHPRVPNLVYILRRLICFFQMSLRLGSTTECYVMEVPSDAECTDEDEEEDEEEDGGEEEDEGEGEEEDEGEPGQGPKSPKNNEG